MPENERQSLRSLLYDRPKGPSFEGFTRGYYNNVMTLLVSLYTMVVHPVGLLAPDAWRRLTYTALLWLPLFFYTMIVSIRFILFIQRTG